MPAKGKSKLSAAQKQRIAAGKALGRPHRDIAAAAGVSRSSVDHRARSAETLTLITALKRSHEEKLQKLYGLVLEEAEKDLTKRSLDARIRTRDQVIRIIQAGDPRLDPISGSGDSPRGGEYTLEELLVSYHKQSVKRQTK